jgi:hypothetical protein
VPENPPGVRESTGETLLEQKAPDVDDRSRERAGERERDERQRDHG